jgi:O-acetyl-ADP-ribose deacetylase (regulator of RNase III)
MNQVTVKIGDLFESSAQTLVNTVNCVGVMGKGIALGFKQRFPAMYDDYRGRCDRGEVRLGRPYLFKSKSHKCVLNFPTKQHWRGVSRISDISAGLEYLKGNYREWGITSLAVPPLGCGNGQLDWEVVGPTLYRYLSQLEIPVELFAPDKTPKEQLTLQFLEGSHGSSADAVVPSGDREPLRVNPSAVAIVAVLSRIGRERFHRSVGRTAFQKVAYFLTVAGVPTGLEYVRGSYGPFSPGLKAIIARLVNNGLVDESDNDGRFVMVPGPTYKDARDRYLDQLRRWVPEIERVADLMLRLPSTKDVELAATALFAARELAAQNSAKPSESEVLAAVMEWKKRRRPSIDEQEAANAIRHLAMLGWLDVRPSPDLPLSGFLAELHDAA